jgi:hypothetical protein
VVSVILGLLTIPWTNRQYPIGPSVADTEMPSAGPSISVIENPAPTLFHIDKVDPADDGDDGGCPSSLFGILCK